MLGRRGRGRGRRGGLMSSVMAFVIIAVVGFSMYSYGPSKALGKLGGLVSEGTQWLEDFDVKDAAGTIGDAAGGSDRPYKMYMVADVGKLKIDNNQTNSPAYERGKMEAIKPKSGSWGAASDFPGWDSVRTIVGSDVYSKCSTRDALVILEGKNVKTKNNCKNESGEWKDPYGWNGDFETTTNPSSFDGEHIVPLKNAWISGAKNMKHSKREKIANDAANLMLTASRPNTQKGDKSIDRWVPDKNSPRFCDYVERYTHVKAKYGLTVTSAEKKSIDNYLEQCGSI